MALVYVMLVLILFFAALYDLRKKKIKNWVCLIILCIGIGVNFIPGMINSFSNSLSGVALGFVILFVIHLLTGMGAGDVKLMAAIGSVVGVESILNIIFYSFMISGLFSLGYLAYRGGIRDMILRFHRLFLSLFQGELTYDAPAANNIASLQVPFAPGIALATLWEICPIIQSAFLSGRFFE